jgi:hypothetical protein
MNVVRHRRDLNIEKVCDLAVRPSMGMHQENAYPFPVGKPGHQTAKVHRSVNGIGRIVFRAAELRRELRWELR